jgi:hypothetical protein
MTFGRAMSFRASSILLLLLDHILRVSAAVYSPSNCYIVAERHSAAGEVGEYVDIDILSGI